MIHFLIPLYIGAAIGVGGCNDSDALSVPVAFDLAQQRDTTLPPSADTYIRQGSPNQNQGGESILRLQESGKNRVLLRWDSAALARAAAGGTVVAARIELTISDAGDNWGTSGRTIELHRLTRAWTELGATWNCAVDSIPTNSSPNCGGATAWDMDHVASYPWAAAVTASAVIHTNQQGVVTLDVTADVAAFVGGSQPNYGWVLRKTDEGAPGRVEFSSSEGQAPPRLAVGVAGDTSRPVVMDSINSGALDRTHVVPGASDSTVSVYRDIFEIVFDHAVSGSSIRAVLGRYQAVIVGGSPGVGAYVIKVPDPGPNRLVHDSLLIRLEAEAGVTVVRPLVSTGGAVIVHGRYPADGAGSARSDWFGNGSSLTRPRIAVRAPLAWGCETGEYGGQLTNVGVADFRFDTNNPDLMPSVSSVTPLSPRRSDTLVSASYIGDPADLRYHHGTHVAGNLSAQGGNGFGVAGIAWRSDLHLYQLSRNDSVVSDPVGYLANVLLPQVTRDSVRVLDLSLDFVSAYPKEDGRYVAVALRSFLGAGAGNLLVVSAGNDGQRASVAAWAGGALPVRDQVLKVAASYLQLSGDPVAGRIVIVPGTDAGGGLWSLSNSVDGYSRQIAAPATNLDLLRNRSQGGMDIRRDSGTSFAAPMVAGAAALLFAMSASLSADQVADYLARGAQRYRRDPLTGDSVPAPSVTSSLYQLDVYGALSLLSSERPGTPICGFPVSLGFNADGYPDSTVVLERPGGFERVRVAGIRNGPGGLSVAQGGRRIAVNDFFYVGDTGIAYQSLLLDHHGVSLGTLPGRWRHYLESATADEQPDSRRPHTLTITPDVGAAVPLDLERQITGRSDGCSEYEVAPDASRAVVIVYCDPGGVGAEGYYLLRLDSSSTTRLAAVGKPAWSHDSRSLVLASPDYNPGTLFASLNADGSTARPDVRAVDRIAFNPRFAGDDATILTDEYTPDFNTCLVVRRAAQALDKAADFAQVDCATAAGTTSMFLPNVRAANRTGTVVAGRFTPFPASPLSRPAWIARALALPRPVRVN